MRKMRISVNYADPHRRILSDAMVIRECRKFHMKLRKFSIPNSRSIVNKSKCSVIAGSWVRVQFKPEALFSKVPKLNGPFSIPSVSQEWREFSSSNLQIQQPHNHYAEVLCIITCTKTARLHSLDPIAEPRAQLQGVGLSVTELSVVVSLVTFHLP